MGLNIIGFWAKIGFARFGSHVWVRRRFDIFVLSLYSKHQMSLYTPGAQREVNV